MEYKKTIILLVLVVFLLSIAGVSASEMDNVIASEDIDSMELSTDNDMAKDNLQTHEECVELTLTDNGDTLSVKNDTEILGDNTGTYSGLSKEIGSGGNIELQHDYYTYDNGNTIYISVANSVIDGKGAVIDMAGSNIRAFDVHASGVTIKNLTIKNANYDGYGGAISFSSSVTSGNVTNCNFINNTASGDGGAIRFCSACAVTNCNFTDNTATSYGGAIEFDGTGNVSNCNFTGNTANYGGAVYLNSGNVTNCNFTGNTANYDGGAVYFYRTGTVSNCNFTGNTATYGGAVYLNSGNVTNCNFTDNSATVNGGAIFFENTGSVTNCNFADNTAYRGGAVYFWNQGTVTNCNFTNNTANKDGGAINMGSGTVTNCNFTGNTATGDGGAVYFENSGNVTNCNFAGNTANDDGGAVYFNANGEVTNCNFTGNTATVDGGAVDFGETGTVSNCNFTNNSAQYGGAVHFVNTGNVTNCNFAGNTADYAGGAVFFTSYGTRTVSNCNFVDNKATGDYGRGGAVYFNGTGEVSNCNFTCNTATYYGGAIYFLDQGTVTNCNFVDNKAAGDDSYGGAVYFQSTGTVSNCNFTNNTATYNGGAVCFGNTGTVSNCNFTNNTATVDGGAVYFNGTGEVTNCNFTGNTATRYGGAVFFYDEGSVSNCNFTGNTATYNGGAVYFLDQGTVSNCNFTGINATTGSAIYFYKWDSSDTLTVSNSTFLNNRANAEALDVVKNDNNITITFTGQNNLLNAIYSRNDAEVTFTNVTYWGAKGITTVSSTMSRSNKAAGQKITVGVVVNNELVLSDVMVTDKNGMIVLDISADDNYYISVRHDADSYYTEAEKTISNNTKFNVNVTSQTTTNKTVNITAKSNIPNDVVQGKLLFILPNGTQIDATYGTNGTWWAVHKFDACGDYKVNAAYVGLDNVTINNGTVTINKVNSTITLENIVLDYGETKNITVTPIGATGIAAKIGESEAKVDGFVISIPVLDAGTYTLTVTTMADANHSNITKNATITVNKLKTELTGNAITITYNINKDLVITLKDSTGKALSGVKVTVVLNGAKTYTTDKNGQVKVSTNGLAPKTYTAKVTFNGNTNYDESTKDIKVTVKKATPKLTAKKKTFKKATKTKKYTIVLKDNTGKAIKKAKVTLKVKGKTYKATTNGRGKAVFKIKKLNKKGTFKAKVTYKGNKYYKKVSKKAKIKVIV